MSSDLWAFLFFCLAVPGLLRVAQVHIQVHVIYHTVASPHSTVSWKCREVTWSTAHHSSAMLFTAGYGMLPLWSHDYLDHWLQCSSPASWKGITIHTVTLERRKTFKNWSTLLNECHICTIKRNSLKLNHLKLTDKQVPVSTAWHRNCFFWQSVRGYSKSQGPSQWP